MTLCWIRVSPKLNVRLPWWLSWESICLQCRRPRSDSWVRKIPWKSERLPTPVFLRFPGYSDDEESACNAGGLDLNPGLGRCPGEENGYALQYSCLENPWREEPGRLQSMGWQRVGHNWAIFTFTKPSVWCPYKRREFWTQTHRGIGHAKTKAEVGGIYKSRKAKDCWQPPEAMREARKDCP